MRDASMGVYYEDEFETAEEMEGKVNMKRESISALKPV
jgi:hypothetical protein